MSVEEKQTRINRIVNDVLIKRRQNCFVDFQALAKENCELMPTLGIRLAAIQAQEQREMATNSHDEKLRFIRDKLSGMDHVECIDRGAQGAVYKAIHRPTQREVAIKIMLDAWGTTEEKRRRFAREVQLVARLRHPNIVRIYDSGEIAGCSFIVMEFVQGVRIDEFIVMEQLSLPQIIALFCQVCDAVHAAHQHGVLHRDLKPSNILIDTDGQARVLDFGLARELDAPEGGSILSLSCQIVGTIPYLSPERITNNDSSCSSDVYALGVVLFELLTGGYPYVVTENSFETLSNIVQDEPLNPIEVMAKNSSGSIMSSEVKGDLEKVILKSLAKEPGRRYLSAGEFGADLQRYLAGDVVLARSDSRIYVLRRTVRRFRTLAISGVICMAFLVMSLIGITSAWRRSKEVAKTAMTGLQMASLLKIGSAQRDSGKTEQALLLFERVIALAKDAKTDDPLVLRELCDAHQRLAGLKLEKNDLDSAALDAKKTFDLAQKLAERDPGDIEAQRQLAFAWNMRGQVAFQRGDFEKALEDFRRAKEIQEPILVRISDDPSLSGDLAFTLGWLGNSARNLGQQELAIQSYAEAHEIFRKLAESEPENLNRGLDLLRAESKMAILHLSFKQPDHDVEAQRWLDACDDRLERLKSQDVAGRRQDSIDKLTFEINSNKALLQRRLVAQSATP